MFHFRFPKRIGALTFSSARAKRWPQLLLWSLCLGLLSPFILGPARAAPLVARPAPTPALSTPVLDFDLLTPTVGWVLLPQALYWTEDAGATWQARTPPGFDQAALATATFVSPLQGWVVWLTVTEEGLLTYILARTKDGGQTWTTQTLALFAPAEDAAQAAALHLQFLADGQTGWLVIKQATSINFSLGTLFRTKDGGTTWERLTLPIGDPVVFENATTGWVTGGADGQAQYGTQDGGTTWQPAQRPPQSAVFQGPTPNGLTQLRAIAAQTAWAQTSVGQCPPTGCTLITQLWATADGGETWTPLALPKHVLVDTTVAVAPAAETSAQTHIPTALYGRSQRYWGQGFDACNIPALSTMQAWIISSPYKVVNLYIGGSSRGCSNPLLTASYISQLSQLGWKFIPTWVGPQAPCTSYPSRISNDPATAYNQGVTEADAAIAAAVNLGLPLTDQTGTVIYYDLEAYSSNVTTACRDAVKSFISGWTGQLRARGTLSGVYGSTCGSFLSDFSSITHVPDILWVAVWLVPYQYRPNVSVWNMACLANTLWVSAQRIRQYSGGHNETWGGATVNIDSNMIDSFVSTPIPASLSAAPATQQTSLATQWWFPWYDSGGNKSAWLMVSNPGPVAASVSIALGPTRSVLTATTIAVGGVWQQKFTDVVTGPVHISSLNGQPIVASQWVWQGANIAPSLVQPSAMPPPQVGLNAAPNNNSNLGATWWLPFYDSRGGDEHALLVGNPGASSASVDVYVGSTALYTEPIAIAPGSAVTLDVDAVIGGPVQVVNHNSQPIWVTERYFAAGPRDFSLVPGTSALDLAAEWWFPYYDSSGVIKDELWVGNPQLTDIPIEVTFGSAGTVSATIPAQSVWFMDLDGARAGPLRVVSTNGAPFYTSRRVGWNGGADFQEFKGVSGWNLAANWWLPRYDSLSRARDEILIGNPGPIAASVAISLANQPLPGSPFAVAAGQAITVEVGELRGGPLRLSNLTGHRIVVGQRSWWDGSTNYTEQMGIPDFVRVLNYKFYVPQVIK